MAKPGLRSGTTESITTSSTTNAAHVAQLRKRAVDSTQPPVWDSVIATIGRVSAAAISIGLSRIAATRALRASIPGSWAADLTLKAIRV